MSHVISHFCGLYQVMPKECRVRISHVIAGACAFASVWSTLAQPVTAPWRRNDAILISVCFDSIGKEAPASLRAAEVTDISASSVTLELIGHTTTGRPTYQGELVHPLRFRSLFFDLPGGGVGRFDHPEKLENSIEGWVYSTSALQCVSGEEFLIAQSVLNGAAIPGASCPDVGAVVSYRVDNRPGYTARRVLERQRGLTVLNGLRGCRESIYGK